MLWNGSWRVNPAHHRDGCRVAGLSQIDAYVEFAFEFLREQHRPQFLPHLVEELGADPRAFPADDLDPLDPDAVLRSAANLRGQREALSNHQKPLKK